MKPKTITNSPLQKKKKITTLLVILSVVITGCISFLVTKQQQKINALRQQAIDLKAQNQNKNGLQQFFATNQKDINLIDKAIPNEAGLVDFVQTTESLINRSGMVGSFHFQTLAPTKQKNDQYINCILKLSGSLTQLITFLRRFEKIPFIAQVSSIVIQSPDGKNGQVEATIGVRIYVQDPFQN